MLRMKFTCPFFQLFSAPMDERLVEKISATKFYLSSLPDTLPALGLESSANALLSFSSNPEWVEDVANLQKITYAN